MPAADPSSSVFVHAAPEYVDLNRPQPSTEIGDALLRVTGHFNDDVAAACSSTDIPIGPDPDGAVADIEPIASELFCRGQFVVTDSEVLDEGSGDLPRLGALEVGGFVAPVVDGVTLREAPGTDGARIGTLSRPVFSSLAQSANSRPDTAEPAMCGASTGSSLARRAECAVTGTATVLRRHPIANSHAQRSRQRREGPASAVTVPNLAGGPHDPSSVRRPEADRSQG